VDSVPTLVGIDNVSLRTPPPVGVNQIVTLQVLPALRDVPQLLAIEKLAVPMLGVPTVIGPIPVFRNVANCVAETPLTFVSAKVREDAAIDAAGAAPDALNAAVLTPAAVVTLSVPVRAVAAVGPNVTVTVQVPAAAIDVPQVVLLKLKSVPDTDALLGTVSVNATVLLLVTVAVAVVVWPT
jgi:hypothetical protein